MSRRSRRKSDTSPSLFPFLAVLICTMGAIIVLLVLVVKNADVQANVASETSQKNQAEKRQVWQDQLELQRSEIDTLGELRPELKARLEQEKAVFGHLVDHVSRLREELKRLQRSLDFLNAPESNTESQASAQLQQEVAQLQKQIVDAKERLETKKQELATARPAFSIIPNSQGGNGTFRRPIFVECNAKGVILQPYGIQLGPADFPRSIGPDNPLDLALLMIRDYWNQIDPNQKEGQPYPLFVVRPTGSKAFAAARKAMKSWVDEFGYELVNAEIEIKYPDADAQFQKRLESAVEQARRDQQNRLVAINRQEMIGQIRRLENQSNSGPGYRTSSLGGGFVAERGGTNEGRRSNAGFMSASQSKPGVASGYDSSSIQNANNQNANEFKENEFKGQANQSQVGSRGSAFEPQSSGRSPQNSTSQFSPNSSSAEQGNGGPNSSPSSGNPAAVAQLPPESIARTRGTDWALPSKANNAIQVRKPIKIQINKDSVQIVEIGKGIRTIPFEQNSASAVPGLIELVWKHIDAWGIAGVNSYWKPTLNLYVAPDAQSRFNDLEILLSGSGLDLRRMQP